MCAKSPEPHGQTQSAPKSDTPLATQSGVADVAGPQSIAGISPERFPWRLALLVGIVLLALGVIGFALMNYAPQRASWYWVVVLPAFAAIGIWHTWSSVNKDGKTDWKLIRRQIYHWVALFLAIKVLFVLIYTGNISGDGAGLMAMLLMALTCTLVGVNFDWVFILVGVVLGAAVLIASWFHEYVWLGLVALGLAVILLLTLQTLGKRRGVT